MGTVCWASARVCSRPRVFRTASSNDWIPREIRVTPISAKYWAFLRSKVAGLASKVNSLSSERSKWELSWVWSSARRVRESMEGVPPPR